MASSHGGPSAPGDKNSRQERVRDNQRRSRARRKEHMADLERRLQECHIICRDADIQRSAYLELQKENACLRTLLALTGVSTELIDSFVRQSTTAPEQPVVTDGVPMRTLKPRPPPVAQSPISSATETSSAFNTESLQAPNSYGFDMSGVADARTPSSTGSQTHMRSPNMQSMASTALLEDLDILSLRAMDWLGEQGIPPRTMP